MSLKTNVISDLKHTDSITQLCTSITLYIYIGKSICFTPPDPNNSAVVRIEQAQSSTRNSQDSNTRAVYYLLRSPGTFRQPITIRDVQINRPVLYRESIG